MGFLLGRSSRFRIVNALNSILLPNIENRKTQANSRPRFFYFLFLSIFKYIASTLVRAQGVLRKNFKLDVTEGLLVKHLMFMV